MKGELAKVPEQNESNLKERVVNLSNKLNFGNSGDRSVATIALLATLVAATIVLILWTSAKNYVPLYGNQESYDKANILEILDKEQITFRIDTDSGNILVPQEKLADAKSRQKAIIMRQKTASSRLEVKKTLDSTKVDNAMGRFEQYERKIDDLESQVEAYDLGKRTLQDEFAELEASDKVEDELAALKAKVKGANTSTEKSE